MEGGKDEENVMGPLFPRLHVNDKEKGGPRAPPRNKMALYEQLSVPSQRFSSASLTPRLPPHNTSALVPSASSQGGGHERSVFSPFYVPPSSLTHSNEDLHFHGAKEFERKSTKNKSYKTSNVTEHLLSAAECNSARPSSKNSSGKKSAKDDDFRIPSFEHGEDRGRLNPSPMCPGPSKVTMANRPQKSITAYSTSSVQLQNSGGKPLKQTNTTDLKSRIQGGNPSKQGPKETVNIKQSTEKATSDPSVVEKIVEASKHASVASIDKCPSASTNECDNSHTGNPRLCQETSGGFLSENNIGVEGISIEPRCLNGNVIVEKENSSRFRNESGSRASLGTSHRRPIDAENCNEESGGKAELGNVDRNDDESETLMIDSISGLDISPDDVVGIIGQKHFWKARKEIVNQQRVFAVQVFELHRLIKVQKLIAGLPDLLLENNPCLSRPPKVPAKKLTSEYSIKSQLQIIMQKDDSQKTSQNTNSPSGKDDSLKRRCTPLGDGVDEGLVSQNSNYGPYSGNISPAPPTKDSSPWCFHPPGNQWLVPIMSPSEGLVYKPYMSVGPQNAGFMTPVYGGCGPLSLPSAPAYGLPDSHQQAGVGVTSGAPIVPQNYFPPAYGLPVMNPIISTPAAEQVNPSVGAEPHQQAKQVSTNEVNFNMHSRSSCNMSNQKSEAFSFGVWKFQTLKDSEIQGSTASSPCERGQRAEHVVEGREGRDALPLFPMDPPMDSSEMTTQVQSVDQRTRVIKVVPHNPRSATESAARIFRSIQKERQQFDTR